MGLSTSALVWICSIIGVWALSFGVGTQVVTQWLKVQGANDMVIGWAHSFYYFGMAVASLAAPWMVRRLGSIRCATLGAMASGMTLAVFPWIGDEWAWHALRFLNGWAGAMCVIPLETIVSRDSAPERKTRNFAYYGVALTLGGALGLGAAPFLYPLGYELTFWIGASPPICIALAFLVSLRSYPERAEEIAQRTPLAWRRNFLSYGTAWSQGFIEGILIAFMQPFLVERAFSAEQAGTLMGVMTVGVIVFQIPVSFLSDRFGKTPTLLACYAIVLLGLLAIPWLTQMLWLALVLFVFGACAGAMYPLGLSLLGDCMPAGALARAYAVFLVIECVGSQAGSAAAGAASKQWGKASMFGIGLAAILGVLLVWLVLQALPTVRAADREIPP